MPSGNKIIGREYTSYINLDIYISPKFSTEGLCGSFDGDQSNDLFHRVTGTPSTVQRYGVIDVATAASWRSVG